MYKRYFNRNTIVVRENRSLKRGPISMSDSLCLKLLVLNSVGYSYSPWHDCPSPVFFAGTNMRTICVVTVGINMANMVAIATLNDICGQKWIAQRLLDRETSIIFLSFWGKRFFFLFARGFILIFAQSNAKIIPWHDCPSPVYPSLQVQLWEPSVFVQFAFMSHT